MDHFQNISDFAQLLFELSLFRFGFDTCKLSSDITALIQIVGSPRDHVIYSGLFFPRTRTADNSCFIVDINLYVIGMNYRIREVGNPQVFAPFEFLLVVSDKCELVSARTI